MNGYDFDKTIMKGNSVRRFCMYCCLRLPYLWLLLPEMLLAAILYGLRIIRKEGFLRMLELFIFFVPNRKKFAARFWNKNSRCIYPWYLEAKRPDDIIISASPDFLIEEICSRLSVSCIASVTNKHGLATRGHCYGANKVKMFSSRYPNAKLETFYSDSMSDAPMFEIVERGYLVRKGKITQVYENGRKIA